MYYTAILESGCYFKDVMAIYFLGLANTGRVWLFWTKEIFVFQIMKRSREPKLHLSTNPKEATYEMRIKLENVYVVNDCDEEQALD